MRKEANLRFGFVSKKIGGKERNRKGKLFCAFDSAQPKILAPKLLLRLAKNLVTALPT